MKILKEEIKLQCPADELWAILSDLGRSDWVPSIEEIRLNDDCRCFEMKGMGKITEKILKCHEKEMILQYSAIETPAPIEHHLATMQIFEELFCYVFCCCLVFNILLRKSCVVLNVCILVS